jgi:hypothetical protein
MVKDVEKNHLNSGDLKVHYMIAKITGGVVMETFAS